VSRPRTAVQLTHDLGQCVAVLGGALETLRQGHDPLALDMLEGVHRRLRAIAEDLHTPADPDRAARPARVLLCEDYAELRALMREQLERAGHTVVGEADEPATAVAIATDARPDVVVLDFNQREPPERTVAILAEAVPGAALVSYSGLPVEAIGTDVWRRLAAHVSKTASLQDLVRVVSAVAPQATAAPVDSAS
jgi:CheY-like chemotaxis protein